jgi:hypothetical protein
MGMQPILKQYCFKLAKLVKKVIKKRIKTKSIQPTHTKWRLTVGCCKMHGRSG